MNYESRVALRYLWAARKKAHTAFLSLISTLGLGVGVGTLIISLALLSGLQGNIKARLMAASPQLLIEPSGSNTIEEHAEVVSQARAEGIESVHTIISGFAWGSTQDGARGKPLLVRSYMPGDDPKADSIFGEPADFPIELGETPIFLTRDFAAAMGVTLGDEIVVVAPRTKLTPFGPVPVWRKYRIARILPGARDEKSAQAHLAFDEASRLFATNGGPTSIEIFAPVEKSEAFEPKLRAAFPSLLVKSWKEINKPLFLALRLEKIVMFATISLIIFVAALNLISSLSMLIVEKRPQIGVLRTLGASEKSILRIFLSTGLLIGLGGTLIGNIVGLGVAWAADKYRLVPLPADIYAVSHIPFAIEAADVIGVNIVAIALSILATLYPAWLAARLDPIAAIKEE